MASQFVIGDEIGNLKLLSCLDGDKPVVSLETVYQHKDGQNLGRVQKLASLANREDECIVAAAFSSGRTNLYYLQDETKSFQPILSWEEPRISASSFIGLTIHQQSIFSVTSSGALRKTTAAEDWQSIQNTQQASLPTRLADWKLNPNGSHFCYGGDEVDMSVWSTERAFQNPAEPEQQPSQSSKKRKRNTKELFHAEIWRAKNLPNDSLNLRQPIRITSVDFIESTDSKHDIVAGTQLGDVRRFDTRAARRPVTVWNNMAKVGGVGVVKKAAEDNLLFVGDKGSNLYAVDLRNGKILYGYKGLSGGVVSMAQAPAHLASISMDRYARLHNIASPPPTPRVNLDERGEVCHKEYLTSTPTSITLDYRVQGSISKARSTDKRDSDSEDENDEELWNNMENVS